MKKNFRLGQSNEVIQNNRVFDLHNLYDFIDLAIISSNTVQLTFEPNRDHGEGLPSVFLTFEGAVYLETRITLGNHLTRDLDEVGYMKSNQQDDGWLLNEDQASDFDHLFFRFGNEFIRIYATQARLIVNP